MHNLLSSSRLRPLGQLGTEQCPLSRTVTERGSGVAGGLAGGEKFQM